MKTRMILLPALLALALIAPANADTFLYAHRVDAVHVNVFRPLGGLFSPDLPPSGASAESPTELSMFFGKLDVLVDPNEWGYPEEGGCVDILSGGYVDFGCGELTVIPDGVMGTTTITGVIESTAYTYDSETGFEEIGPSQIVVDLVVTGTGAPELSPYTNYAAGVCGLPPDTRGVFVDGRPELQRDAGMTGTLESVYAGAIDPTAFSALLVQAPLAAAGVCL